MQSTVIDVDCSKKLLFSFVAKGDQHIGTILHDKIVTRRVIDTIARQQLPWIDIGDCCDSITRHDVRFQADIIDDSVCPSIHDIGTMVSQQIKLYTGSHRKIKHLCLAQLQGNHESKMKKLSDLDPYDAICEGLNPKTEPFTKPPFRRDSGHYGLGMCGWVILRLWRTKSNVHNINIFLHHGYFAGRLGGSKTNNLERLLGDYPAADIIIVGHGHDYIPRMKVYRRLTKSNEVYKWYRVAMMVPPLTHTYSDTAVENYAGRAGYPEPILGAVRVTIDVKALRSDMAEQRMPYKMELIT